MSVLRAQLHLHSCLSPCADDDMTPANIAGMAMLAGLDVAAVILTEGVPPDETVAELAESRGVNLLGSERDTLETGAALLSLLGA